MVCSLLVMLIMQLSGQQTHSSDFYLKKSKNQKSGAWILLGGGIALMGAGFLIGDRKESTFDDAATGVVIGGIGFLSTIGSIPLFIASSKNKKRGMSTSGFLKLENTYVLKQNDISHLTFPAAGIQIKL